MATAKMNQLGVHNATSFIESVRDSTQIKTHLFVGKSAAWENESSPPSPDNSVAEYLKVQKDILGLEEVNQNDCLMMVRHLNWTSNVVYDKYRHDYNLQNTSFSNASNIVDANFYVLSSNNLVYVCLDNNNDGTSKVAPLDIGSDPFYTSDGYQWMRLYDIPNSSLKYMTDNLLPVIDSRTNVKTAGGIFTTLVDNPGNLYVSGDFYCKVDGDGTDAVAVVNCANGKVQGVRMIREGKDYTNATVRFNKDEVYRSLVDLDNDVNKIDPSGDGSAILTPVISPLGGWGKDVPVQLGASRVGVFVIIGNKIQQNITYRQVGLIQNPEFDSSNNYIPNTGRIIFLTNISPVTRIDNQTERINLSVSF